MINNLSDEELDDIPQIDTVEIPSEEVDAVSDIKEENLGPQATIGDTAGQVEIHFAR